MPENPFKKLIQSITKLEWGWLIFVTIFVVIVTTLPSIYGYLSQGNLIYTGSGVINPVDYNVYYSYINQVKDGHFLFHNLYNGDLAGRTITSLNVLWLGIGLMARFFNLSAILAFQLARVIFLPLLIFTLYLWAAYLFPEIKKRFFALLLLIFGTGLGVHFIWLAPVITKVFPNLNNSLPMDIWVSEAFVFLAAIHSPHMIASLFLLLLSLLLFLLAQNHQSKSCAILAGFSSLILFQFHTYHAITLYSITIIFSLYLVIITPQYKKIYLSNLLIYIILSSPTAIHYTLLITTNYFIGGKASQNVAWTTPLFITLISYGFFIPLTILGIYYLIRQKMIKRTPWLFLIIWLLVQSIIIYLPFVVWQRRLTEGLIIPLILLSAWLIFYLLEKKYKKINNQLLILTIIFLTLFNGSNIFVLSAELYTKSQHQWPEYISQENYQVFQWLKNNTSFDQDTILAPNHISNFIPAFSSRFVFASHGGETIDFANKYKMAAWFFSNQSTVEERNNWLTKYNITYVFYPKKIKTTEVDPGYQNNKLENVFENNEAIIYKVNQ